jgi:hypothetical protein
VEPTALDRAEVECRADEAVRAARRARAAVRREELDREFVARFAARVREIFPGMPAGVESGIAEHACRKHSGRVGRSAAAKALEAEAVALAVVAHVRHRETPYDRLLSRGFCRRDARAEVSPAVDEVIGRWKALR